MAVFGHHGSDNRVRSHNGQQWQIGRGRDLEKPHVACFSGPMGGYQVGDKGLPAGEGMVNAAGHMDENDMHGSARSCAKKRSP